jgi:hypothetical protein
LPALNGWEGRLLLDLGTTGIWTVKPFAVFPQYAVPEVVGLDDLGRCHVLVSYSGKWTPQTAIQDGKWLGAAAEGDVDRRIDGQELYVGGQRGHLYQVVAYDAGVLDARLIAQFPGREIHTIVAADLDAETEGWELLVFTRPGGLYRLHPRAAHGRFEHEELGSLPGRVRDAVVVDLPSAGGTVLATVSRVGELSLLRLSSSGYHMESVFSTEMGMGRIAASSQSPESPVLYSTLDDGRILQHTWQEDHTWETGTIHRGDPGPRGLAVGRFDEGSEQESVAIFGYNGKVQLLRPSTESWSVETIFEDRDKGHWLAAAELDGRNQCQELLACGYGGRVVMLLRP